MITATFTISESEYIELQNLYLAKTSANRTKYSLIEVFGFSVIAVAFTANHLSTTDWIKLLLPLSILLLLVLSPFYKTESSAKDTGLSLLA